MVVRISARRKAVWRDARRLRRSLKSMMEQLAPGRDLELSVSLVSDGEIAALNSEHMKLKEPTDVLSFPLMDRDEVRQAGLGGFAPEPIGDIVISLDTAGRQASEHGVPFYDEVEMLATHGLLHLFGYEHEGPAESAEMAQKERELLGRSIIGEVTGEG